MYSTHSFRNKEFFFSKSHYKKNNSCKVKEIVCYAKWFDLNDSYWHTSVRPNKLTVHWMQFVFLSEQIAITTYSLPSFICVHFVRKCIKKTSQFKLHRHSPAPPNCHCITVAFFPIYLTPRKWMSNTDNERKISFFFFVPQFTFVIPFWKCLACVGMCARAW